MKRIAVLSILLIAIFSTSCCGAPPPLDENTMPNNPITPVTALTSSNGTFLLGSAEVVEGGELPKEFTCDGGGATLPLSWKDAPEGTKSFVVIMHHVPGLGDTHWYWVVYNIPSNIMVLEKNAAGVGTLGNNSVNGETQYAPPCSKGPGEKVYTYTVYALSAEPQLSVPASEVTRDVLLEAIQGITLASAALNVAYTR